MRPDGELAIAGANFVAGDSPARVFGYRRRRAFNAAQIRLRPVETETVESNIPKSLRCLVALSA